MKNIKKLIKYLQEETGSNTYFDDGYVCYLNDDDKKRIATNVDKITHDWKSEDWDYINDHLEIFKDIADSVFNAAEIDARIEWEMGGI